MTETFISTMAQNPGEFPIEAGRYHLVVGDFCPYAHRADLAYRLAKLEDAISLTKVNPIKTGETFDFTQNDDGKDPVLDVQTMGELYHITDPAYDGRCTIPVLVDLTDKKIVNKESAELVELLGRQFKSIQGEGAFDLFPEGKEAEIEEVIEAVNKKLLGTIYGMDNGSDNRFKSMKKRYTDYMAQLDERLKSQRYVLGDQLTAADIFVYTPLVRLEPAHSALYARGEIQLQDYPHLWAYMRDLYQMPEFHETTHFSEIQKGYYSMNGRLDEVDINADFSHWDEPHGRGA